MNESICIAGKYCIIQKQLLPFYLYILFFPLVVCMLFKDVSSLQENSRDLMQHHSPTGPAVTGRTGTISDSCNLGCSRSTCLIQSHNKTMWRLASIPKNRRRNLFCQCDISLFLSISSVHYTFPELICIFSLGAEKRYCFSVWCL